MELNYKGYPVKIKDHLKKYFDLKKFIKLLNKTRRTIDGFDIYYDYLDSCSHDSVDWEVYANQITRHDQKLYEEFRASFPKGLFFKKISSNFKVEKIEYVDYYDQYVVYQIIKSKINKTYYIAVYSGWNYAATPDDPIRDSYYITKKFKEKKSALKFIKGKRKK
jgi:hypothetical protein|tara:strand:- start:40 stop:531 length:492 start_codon:yes stop_codon:yes gene_type:complete